MSTKVKEILAVIVITIFCLIFYIGKINGWETIEFSSTVSMVIIFLLVLSLVWILILTIKGKMIERRIVFLFVGIAVTLPLFMGISQKIKSSPEVVSLYESVDALPAGSKVLISFDYDPPSAPELQPMAETFLHLCFEKNLKVITMGLWPQGPQQASLAFEKVFSSEKLKGRKFEYGVDYVNLGFQTGNEFVIQRMGSSFKSMFPTDYVGNAYDDLPLVKNIKNFSNIDYCFNLSAGFPGTVEWIQIGVDRFGVLLGAGNTAVQAPQIYPYLNAKQLTGLLGGMNGAAEFEVLTGNPGKGTKFMLSQSFSHMVVIAFVLIGNVAFFMSGRKSQLLGNEE
ncbi:MAG: hypothetical protein DRP35_04015 [Candidatus Zixiibacteriota bacterium]|nr:MAG: hypothetical protein DRP35_04015 [candidate division Zixibacteria bacterium]